MVLISFRSLQPGQLDRALSLLLEGLFQLHHSPTETESLAFELALAHDLGCDRNVVDLVLRHDVELVTKLPQQLRNGPQGHHHFPGHPHGDLSKGKSTGPISLRETLA